MSWSVERRFHKNFLILFLVKRLPEISRFPVLAFLRYPKKNTDDGVARNARLNQTRNPRYTRVAPILHEAVVKLGNDGEIGPTRRLVGGRSVGRCTQQRQRSIQRCDDEPEKSMTVLFLSVGHQAE